jgi:hypothetical protein
MGGITTRVPAEPSFFITGRPKILPLYGLEEKGSKE